MEKIYLPLQPRLYNENMIYLISAKNKFRGREFIAYSYSLTLLQSLVVLQQIVLRHCQMTV